jgi:protein-tyrosine-phosphatase
MWHRAAARIVAPEWLMANAFTGGIFDSPPIRVLFLCTRNSARSQIAEALLSTSGGRRVVAASAGSEPGPGVHPMAVDVLAEVNIDWAGRGSQGIDAVVDQSWDAVVTVCDAARDACPYMPSAGLIAHWGLEDPAAAQGQPLVQQIAFRTTRDRLGAAVSAFLDSLERSPRVDRTIAVRAALDAGSRALNATDRDAFPLSF